MNDRGLSVLEQYGLKIKNSYRGRGSMICDTDRGLKLVREFNGSSIKLEFQNKVLRHVEQAGSIKVDTILENLEGSLVSRDKDEVPYIVKDWFEGRECDTKNQTSILAAVRTLATLHKDMQLESPVDQTPLQSGDLLYEYERHNRELKRVRNFIKDKRKKNDFELCFLSAFNIFYEQGQNAWTDLQSSSYQILKTNSIQEGKVSHGEYNHHNILVTRNGNAITNFDKCAYDIQISDLYHFMRKILEKQNWNERIGAAMIEEYNKIKTIQLEELEYLHLRLSYPEKFWKLANHYFNSNKAWIPGKNIEKVKILTHQQQQREKFLNTIH